MCTCFYLKKLKFSNTVIMLSKVGDSVLKLLSRCDRKLILKYPISVPNTLNVFRQEQTNFPCRCIQRHFCNEVNGNQTTGLLNIQNSGNFELTKDGLDDSLTEKGLYTSELSQDAYPSCVVEECEEKIQSENFNKLAKNGITNNINSDSNAFSTERNSDSFSRFQLPSDWKDRFLGTQGIKFPGEVYIIKTQHDEVQHVNVLEGFLKQSILGFDSEHFHMQDERRTFVCVVQLATHEKAVLWQFYDFQRKMKMPHYLKKILTGGVRKVGHACMDDAVLISKQFEEDTQNLIDTKYWSIDLQCSPQSLQGLCAIFLGKRLTKTYQLSNWMKKTLSPGQINYAATDAWISLKVYEEMKRQAKELGVTLTPMYKNLQQYYSELEKNKLLRNQRKRKREKEKKAEKALQLAAQSSTEAQTSNVKLNLNHVSEKENVDETLKDSDTTTDNCGIDDKMANADETQNGKAETLKNSIGSRQRHKRFLEKFHSLE